MLSPAPEANPRWGLSSAGRAVALQASGRRFDPDRLHQGWIRSESACDAFSRPIRTAFDNREERETSEPLVPPSVGVTWGRRIACPKAVLFQVKYTNRMFPVLTRAGSGKMYDFRLERAGLRVLREDGRGAATKGAPRDLSVSGSDQAREGRLVDALAARGDEGRDTLR